jgi:CBS domain-containing protein
MSVGEICTREVVVVHRTDTIREVARLMRQYHVGDLVVVKENGRHRKPVGIITDRDIVISVVAPGLDPDVLRVSDMVAQELVTAPETQGVFETIQQMRFKGIRRLPIVGSDGTLVGIVAIDDLIQLLAEEMGELAKVIAREQAIEVKTRK